MASVPASGQFEIDLTDAPAGGVATVRLAGTLDVSSQAAAEAFLGELVAKGHVRLALDCADLAFVSSAGLRALIGAVKLVKPHGGGVAVCAPRPPIRQLIEFSGLKALLALSDSVDAGRTAVGA
jgi:anti-sigma B factor antagonist